ncbi:MAG: hypothetical protein R2877_08445 [Bdellovibrionota bacterium]
MKRFQLKMIEFLEAIRVLKVGGKARVTLDPSAQFLIDEMTKIGVIKIDEEAKVHSQWKKPVAFTKLRNISTQDFENLLSLAQNGPSSEHLYQSYFCIVCSNLFDRKSSEILALSKIMRFNVD